MTPIDFAAKLRASNSNAQRVRVFGAIFQGVRAQEFKIGCGGIRDVIRYEFFASSGWDNGQGMCFWRRFLRRLPEGGSWCPAEGG